MGSHNEKPVGTNTIISGMFAQQYRKRYLLIYIFIKEVGAPVYGILTLYTIYLRGGGLMPSPYKMKIPLR
jgi:hypothetical protein